ncbi:prolyl oligopeptidase family serine peptidase, partial [Sphaerisporangium sp. TRM90804]|uniref:S9 family peptidase n=1 Tax=Sphaerisporangium sp. TRM90804 TaxID=3031113 RepID=UPI0024473906
MDIDEFPRQIARTQRFTLGVPRAFTLSPDGRRLLFLRTRGGQDRTSCLWLLEGGRERLLADPGALGAGGPVPEAERIRRERARERAAGVVAYAADAALRTAVFAVDGRLWAVDTGGGDPRPVDTAGPVTDPRPDPAGRHVAYVSGGALRVVRLRDGEDRLLAAPDGPEVSWGLAEHVAAESMHRARGHWWSPEGTRLLAARVDTTRVRRWWVADPGDPSRPPRRIAYPAAGTPNALVSLHVLGLDGGAVEVSWDREGFEYLTAAAWDAHGPLIGVQSRDQRTLLVLSADPETGATTVLHRQHDTAWVHLVPGTPARTASGTLVHTTDTTDTTDTAHTDTAENDVTGGTVPTGRGREDDPARHPGAVPAGATGGETEGGRGDTRRLLVGGRAVTPRGLQVQAVVEVSGESVLFTAVDDPTGTGLWSYDPGRGPVRLSRGPGVHTGARAGGTLLLASHTEDGHAFRLLREGEPDATVASLQARPLHDPRVTWLSLGEREIRTALLLPSWHRPGRSLPVLMAPYGGPAMRLVTRARHAWLCEARWFAESGFAVVVADGRGTPGRGPAWEKSVHGDSLTAPLEDQVTALRGAAAHCPDLDLGRVGIRGWSYGGTLAAAAVLRMPEVFHAAVSGAAPSDQRLYDTHWRERFLGHPDREPGNYERSSPIGDAARLRRPLLLVHGLADDNVVAAHTLRMSAALLAAGRPHQVLPLPGATHMPTDEAAVAGLFIHQLRFLREALDVAPPPPQNPPPPPPPPPPGGGGGGGGAPPPPPPPAPGAGAACEPGGPLRRELGGEQLGD